MIRRYRAWSELSRQEKRTSILWTVFLLAVTVGPFVLAGVLWATGRLP